MNLGILPAHRWNTTAQTISPSQFIASETLLPTLEKVAICISCWYMFSSRYLAIVLFAQIAITLRATSSLYSATAIVNQHCI